MSFAFHDARANGVTLRPETFEEKVVWHLIVWTWFYYVLGALYIIAPVLGWWLFGLALLRWLRHEGGAFRARIPPGVQVWTLGMFAMLLALVVGHLGNNLGLGQLLKSSIGWAKGWALLFLFPFAGAMLRVRPAIIYRATNRLALQTLLLLPVFFISAIINLPHALYISPLYMLGGPGPEFFAVEFHTIDNTNGAWRWRFFSPWSPAAAFLANLSFIFAMYERDKFWRTIGIVGSVVVCLMTASRLALVVLPSVVLIIMALTSLSRPLLYGVGAIGGTIGGISLPLILKALEWLEETFNSARVDSTRVRNMLATIAVHRWRTEAPIFGHGVVERGPQAVEYMPIGSHHSWYGLLFVKGIVGFLALAIPLVWTFVEFVIKAQADRVARAALGLTVVIAFYTFGENLEILAYLFWPALLVIGTAMQRRARNPLRVRLGA